ncbi:hypothetical protein VTK73DRAFT_4574 [Phialemonium thermophilum]|uniref:Uncharacterized protein n=1 Tax=Phialemonium thermophilum TaxID=223376 RepID=A0ABR3V833_9PEZI
MPGGRQAKSTSSKWVLDGTLVLSGSQREYVQVRHAQHKECRLAVSLSHTLSLSHSLTLTLLPLSRLLLSTRSASQTASPCCPRRTRPRRSTGRSRPAPTAPGRCPSGRCGTGGRSRRRWRRDAAGPRAPSRRRGPCRCARRSAAPWRCRARTRRRRWGGTWPAGRRS